jgi:hypothetical protein
MADSSIDSVKLLFQDNWTGPIRWDLSEPEDGFTGARHHSVASAAYPIGTKIAVYQEHDQDGYTCEPGWCTFMYLQVGTQNAAGSALGNGEFSASIDAKSFVVPDSGTNWWQITNDPDSCVTDATGAAGKRGSLGAVALSAMTDAYYGWFQVGGPVAEAYVSGLGGAYRTNASVAEGPFAFIDGSLDMIVLGPVASTSGDWGIAGFSLSDDAN